MVPRGAWEAIQDVSSLEQAIGDLEYRETLRTDHGVRPRILPCVISEFTPRKDADLTLELNFHSRCLMTSFVRNLLCLA